MSDLFLRPLFTWRSAVASKFGPKSPVTRYVLLTLAFQMNSPDNPVCRLTIGEIADMTALSERAVVTHIGYADADHWLARRLWRTNSHGWRAMEYSPRIPDTLIFNERVEANAQQQRAHRLVASALKSGRLVRQPCEICTHPVTEAHHDDYNFPLAVRWLCRLHHIRFHVEQRAALRAAGRVAA